MKALVEGKVWTSSKTLVEWEELVRSFILQHYWIKLPPYGGENTRQVFSLFTKHYHDQAMLKKVKEIVKMAKADIQFV